MSDYDRILQTALDNYAANLEDAFDSARPIIAWLETPERKRLRKIGPIHGPDRPPMIVSELIAELQALPQDAEVWTRYDGDEEPYPRDDDFLCSDGRVFI